MLEPTLVFAQSRGGSCRGAICEFTGGIIGALLLGAFLLSIAGSISQHGFLAGLIRHKGVQFLVLYAAGLAGIMLLAAVAYEFAGKTGGVIVMLLLMIGLHYVQRRSLSSSNSPRKSDTDDA